MMLLDIIDNLPRLRLSSNHMKLILWLLKELGVPHVPSFNSIRKVQKNLTEEIVSKPTPHISSLGNHFHVNDIRDAISRVCSLLSAEHFKSYLF